MKKYLCYDVGGTFVKYAIYAEDATVITKGKFKTRVVDANQFFSDLAKIANEQSDLDAIGISFPGFINPNTGEATRAGALYQLDGLNLVDELKTHLNNVALPVVIENDANCAALAEKLNGNAQDVHDFAVVTLGTGVGGGIVINDHVLHGYQYRAGEFGMMLTDYSEHGEATLHDLASTSALVKLYAQTKRLPVESVSGEQIMAEVDTDSQTRTLVDQWANYVAIAIFNLSVTNAPERILIGGGISQNDKLLPIINAALNRIRFWSDFKCDLKTCAHHNDSGLLGALYLAQQIH